MKRYLYILITILMASITSCTDSELEDWDAYLASSKQASSLTLDKTSINAPASSTTETVAIKSNDNWTATASETWVTLSATSGTSDQTITVNISENKTTSTRTGNVTIKTAGGKSAIINIVQEPKTLTIDPTSLTFDAAGGSSTINITTNGTYKTTKNADWLNIFEGYTGVNVSVKENKGEEQRVDTIKIEMTGLTEGEISYNVVVTQFGTDYFLSIDTTAVHTTSLATSVAINLSTNDTWEAVPDSSWIILSSTSGSGSKMLTINLTENKTPNLRRGMVTFTGTTSRVSKTLTITQDGKTLVVNPTTVTLPNSGGSTTISIVTDGSFSTEPSEDANWISLTSIDNAITVTAEENKNTSSRSGIIDIKLTGLTSGELHQPVTVYQSATSYSWRIDQETLTTTSQSGTLSFSIFTNDDWTITNNNDWINLSANSGTGNKTINITVSDNARTESRTGSIIVKGVHSGNSSTITVTQNGRYLIVDPSSLSFDAAGGSSEVKIDTDGTFSASTSDSWLNIKTNGNLITITAAQNENKGSRNGQISVKLTGVTGDTSTKIINISQAGTDYNFSVDKSNISFTSAENSEAFTLSTNDNWTASSNAGWLTLSKTSGKNTETIKVTASENTTTDQRTGSITLTGTNSGSSMTISVSQDGKYLTIAPSSLNFGSDGGSSNVTVSTDGQFTTSKSDSWITVSTSGNIITVSASKNSTPTLRTGSVSVSMTGLTSGTITRTIEVTQSASSYSFSIDKHEISATSAATSQNVVLTTNDSWVAETDESWITLSPNSGNSGTSVKVNLAENKTPSSRTGTVTFKGINSGKTETVNIIQDGKYLSVSPTSVNFEADGGSASVAVTTDATFDTSKSDSWITVSTSSNTVTISAAKNTGSSARNGTVTISASGLSSGSLTQTISVSQSGTEYHFSVDKNSVTSNSKATNSSISLTTNDSWTATSTDNWITVSPTSGNGNASIKISLTENKTTTQRKGTVTIMGANSGSSATVTVTQDGKYLTVDPTSLSYTSEGGSKNVSVSTDGTFKATASEGWITVTTSGNTVIVKAAENADISSRTGTVTISLTDLSTGSLSKTISITQSGASIYGPTVSTTSITKTSEAGTATITVSTNDSWKASSSASWLTLSTSSGTGDATITIDLAENKTTSSRSGTITVKGTNSGSSATVTVTQAGKYLTISPSSLTYDADGGSKTVTVNTDGTFTTSKSASWITVSTSGSTITVEASANTSTDSRTGMVTVSLSELTSGSLSRTINVKQNAKGGVSIDDYGDLKPLD